MNSEEVISSQETERGSSDVVTHTHTHTYICKKLTCYIKNIRDITMDNKLTTVPDDAATRETNPKKI